MPKRKRGRPQGSKNKIQSNTVLNSKALKSNKTMGLDRKAKHFADLFIASEHIGNAELLAIRILEKIRSSKKQLEKKYGGEK